MKLKQKKKNKNQNTWFHLLLFQNSFSRAYELIFKSICKRFYGPTWISNNISQPRQKFQTKILMCDNRRMHNLNFEWLCLSTGISLKKKWQDEKKNKLKKAILWKISQTFIKYNYTLIIIGELFMYVCKKTTTWVALFRFWFSRRNPRILTKK